MSWGIIAETAALSTDKLTVTTSAVDTTGADLIVLAVSQYNSTIVPTDSAGNTWTSLTDYTGSNYHIQFFYCESPITSTTHTFNLTDTVHIFPALAVLAVSGSAASPFDVENGLGFVAAATVQSGSITPSVDGALIIGGVYDDGDSANTFTSVTDFTTSDVIVGTTTSIGIGIAYLIQTTAAPINPTWTFSAVPSGLGAIIASFLPASSGTTYYQTNAGSATPSGTIAKTTKKLLSGSSSSSGTITKFIFKNASGSLNLIGIVNKKTSRILVASISASGIVTTAIVFVQNIAGSLTPSGTIAKLIKKLASGSSTLSGTVNKKIKKQVSGLLQISGIVNKLTRSIQSGAVALSGAVQTLYIRFITLAGSITGSGTVSYTTGKAPQTSNLWKNTYDTLRRLMGFSPTNIDPDD